MAFQTNVSSVFQEAILVRLTNSFSDYLRLDRFLAQGKEAKIITLPKLGRNTKLLQKFASRQSALRAKLFLKLIFKTIQKRAEERNSLSESRFGFRADHSTTLQCVRLADHVMSRLNNSMSTGAVFLDIEKACDTARHIRLLYTLSELEL
jgi:hypothetical protein